jgi:tetratricopeptide (TPR) repeat protein
VPKRKISQKELKRPDQFLDFWTRASNSVGTYASSHTRALIVSLTALATVIAGSVAISQVSEGRSIRAAEALDRVQRIASAEVATPGATPPASEAGDEGIPHLPSEKEQLEAALKELDASFPGSHGPLHAEAMLVRGGLLLDLDRAAEAVTLYQALLADNLDHRLRFLAHEGLGYGYERLGKLVEAQAAFTALGDDASGMEGFYKDRALYHQARLAELRSNPADAARIYHEVLDKNPTTSLREEITNRLAALEMK